MKGLSVLLVKVGGSITTDKTSAGGVRPSALRKIARAVSALRRRSPTNLVIALGGGSIGHRAAVRYGLVSGEVFVPAQIHRMSKAMFLLKCSLAQAFEAEGLAGLPFHETSTLLADDLQVACQGDAIRSAIHDGFVPILSGGPVLSPSGGMIAFNSDRVAHALLASGCFEVKRFILFCDVPGVIGNDGQVIPLLSRSNLADAADLGLASGVVDVSGGMMSKVEICLNLASLGVECAICGVEDLETESFLKIADGTHSSGTRIPPTGAPQPRNGSARPALLA